MFHPAISHAKGEDDLQPNNSNLQDLFFWFNPLLPEFLNQTSAIGLLSDLVHSSWPFQIAQKHPKIVPSHARFPARAPIFGDAIGCLGEDEWRPVKAWHHPFRANVFPTEVTFF